MSDWRENSISCRRTISSSTQTTARQQRSPRSSSRSCKGGSQPGNLAGSCAIVVSSTALPYARWRPLGNRLRRARRRRSPLTRPKLIRPAVTISKNEGIIGVLAATATSRQGKVGPRPQLEGRSLHDCEIIRVLLTAIEHLHQTVMAIGVTSRFRTGRCRALRHLGVYLGEWAAVP